MATFTGINKQGQEFNFEAENSDQALTNEQLASDSGIRATQPKNEPSALTSDDLNTVDDIKFVQPEPNTKAVGLQAQIEQSLTDNEKLRAEEARNREKDFKSSEEDITSFIRQSLGATELTARAQEQTGVPEIQKELDTIDQQLREEQNALRRQIERIQSGAGTATAGQRNISVQEAERNSLRKQADLSIIRLGIQGRFDSAQAIAKQKVDIQLEQDEREFAALSLTFENFKEQFTESEKRAFEASQTKFANDIQTKRETLESINNLAITAGQNGASPTLMQQIFNAKTPEEAGVLAASYLVDPMERAIKSQQLANSKLDNLIKRAEIGDPKALKELNLSTETSDKINLKPKEVATVQKEIVGNDAYKSIQKSVDSITALKEYEKLFEEVGTTSGLTSPFDNERLKTAYNTTTLNLKEFFNLGVLNGPDLEIIQGVLGKPTEQGLPGASTFIAGVGAKAGIENMYKQIESSIDDKYLSLRSQYGQYDPSQVQTLTEIDRTYLQNKAKINPKVADFLQKNPNISVEDAIRVINTNL